MLDQCDVVRKTDTGVTHKVYGSFAEAEHLKPAWNKLAMRIGDLFCSYDWCEIWWRHFGRNRRLEIHTLQKGDELLAVLPLFREVLLAGWICLHMVRLVASDYASDAAGLAMEPNVADSFLDMVVASLGERGTWDVLHLGPLRSYNTITDSICCVLAGSALVQTLIVGRQDNWLTLYDLAPTFDGYLQALPRHERHDIQRRQRRLCETHDVVVAPAKTRQEVTQGMKAVIDLHQKIWTEKGESGHFGSWPSQAAFHQEVAHRLAETGQLALLTLKVDGEVVGASYGYHFGSRTHGLVRGYCNDGPWRAFSLGRLLHCQFVKNAIERGSCVLESGRGIFDYKLRLGGRLHGERSITAIRRGLLPRVRFWAALRIAYLVHALYGRVWMDMIAPKMGLRRATRHFYVRHSFLAQLFRRTRFQLFGGQRVQEARCVSPLPAEAPHAP